MKSYLLKRLSILPLMLLGILCLNFFIACFLFKTSENQNSLDSQLLDHLPKAKFSASLKEHYHLELPWAFNSNAYHQKKHFFSKSLNGLTQTRFAYFMKRIFQMDFGISDYYPYKSAKQVFMDHLKVSIQFALAVWILSFICSFTLGFLMAYFFQSHVDRFFNAFFLIALATPLPLFVLFLKEPTFLGGIFSPKVFAFLTFLIIYSSLYSRVCKTLFLSIFNEPYVLFFKNLGVSKRDICLRVLFKEAFAKFTPLYLNGIGGFLSALLLVENLFEIQGMGYLFLQSILNHDLPLLLISILFSSSLTLLGYFFSESSLYLLLPKAKYEQFWA